MDINGKYTFNAQPQQVWDVMLNPDNLRDALPGCDGLEEQAPGQYEAIMKIGIGAVKGIYKGKVEIADPEEPVRYTLRGEGTGAPGFMKGSSVIELQKSDSGTDVVYKGTMEVGGLIAGVGQRMISGVVKMMLKQFFQNMSKKMPQQTN